MFILDSLLVGGLRFVLDKIALAADRELNDETSLRERLLEAQMRLELGEIDQDEFTRLEAEILERIRRIRSEQRDRLEPEDLKVTGVEVTFRGGDRSE